MRWGFFGSLALDSSAVFGEIAAPNRTSLMTSQPSPAAARQIIWPSVVTVISAAILIGAEVFGAAFAGGWAVANLLDLGPYGVHIMQGIFFLCGIAIMAQFVRNAHRIEPFTAHE